MTDTDSKQSLKAKLQRNVKPTPARRTAETFHAPPDSTEPTHRTSVDLPIQLRARLRHAAIDHNITMAAMIVTAIDHYLGRLSPTTTIIRRTDRPEGDTFRTTISLPATMRRNLGHAAIDHNATMADLILAAITDHLDRVKTQETP